MSTTEETGPGLEPIGLGVTPTVGSPALGKTDVYAPLPGSTIGDYKNHPGYKATSLEEVLRGVLTPGPITDNVVACHVAAWNAGWYHDLKTGLPKQMNAGERMLLMCSELGEGQHGLNGHRMDDKLPHRKMIEVELADFEIRLFDYCGAGRYDLQVAVNRSEDTELVYLLYGDNAPSTSLLWIACQHIFNAMEAHRKARREEHVMCLARAYRVGRRLADAFHLDVDQARVEKMAFNKVRPDHQKANRLAADGKDY
jgi:hypothetical protein